MGTGRRNIVIMGAGFGGITALLKLYSGLRRHGLLSAFRLILIDRASYHLYTPSLYEIAAALKNEAGAMRLKSSICIPIDDVIRRFPMARFIGEAAIAVDPGRHIISFASGNAMSFDYLVVAIGAETNFYGIPGMAEYSIPLKTFEDSVRLRNRIEELTITGAETIRILVGGGGATGVEAAAELMHSLCYRKRRRAGSCRMEIVIIDAAPEIPASFGTWTVRRARQRLKTLGVKIMTGKRIYEVRPSTVMLDGISLPYDLLIWAGGTKPSGALSGFGLSLDRRGGVVVNEFMEAQPRIYAIGDNASIAHPRTGALLPGNVPVAEAGARLAAKNILADITGENKCPIKPAATYPFILAVGGKYAVADLIFLKFSGFAGWILKQLVELRYLSSILPLRKAASVWINAVRVSALND